MSAAYIEDTDRLGLGRPDHEPRASEWIGAIVEEIEALLAGGHAYEAQGDVYFRVRSDPRYGALSRRTLDAMDQGEGVEGAERKEDPLDFALWKAQKPGEDSAWDAPWGRGRPGWHIECSAMAEQHLGVGFDIHGGGLDLLFPHHENEAAQTRCARGAEFAGSGCTTGCSRPPTARRCRSRSATSCACTRRSTATDGTRSCSTSRAATTASRSPTARTRSRQPLPVLRGSARPRASSSRGPSPQELRPLRDRFFAALADDFRTPEALAAMWEWIREANRRGEGVGDRDLREMLGVLALENLFDAASVPPAVEGLAAERRSARAGGDYARADALRTAIEELGWSVRDTPDGDYDLTPLE